MLNFLPVIQMFLRQALDGLSHAAVPEGLWQVVLLEGSLGDEVGETLPWVAFEEEDRRLY